MLEFKNVFKSFNLNKSNQCSVLKDLSFLIGDGEYVAIRGKSGSGKTTILKLVALLERPDIGEIFVENHNILQLKGQQISDYRNTKIGYVVQDFMLIDGYQVYENVMLPLYFSKMSAAERKKKAVAAMKTVGVFDLAEKQTWQLSGGEKQRVAIARAIVNSPSIVLADEPTGSLDAENTDIVLQLFDTLVAEGKTLITVTHDDYVGGRAQRQIVLDYGKIV